MKVITPGALRASYSKVMMRAPGIRSGRTEQKGLGGRGNFCNNGCRVATSDVLKFAVRNLSKQKKTLGCVELEGERKSTLTIFMRSLGGKERPDRLRTHA